jgi:2'-5' RNA ligase
VTLAFLGNVVATRIPELQRIAREQSAAFTEPTPATLSFARLAHWQEAQVLCALATEERPTARALAVALQEATSTAGFSPDRKPFQAHVTLARKVIRPGTSLRLRPVVWRFESFALIDSRTQPSGAVYSVIETYPLASAMKARD